MGKFKKINIVIILVIAAVMIFAAYKIAKRDSATPDSVNQTTNITSTKVTPIDAVFKEEQTIFIPYWNIPKSANKIQKYDTLIYFGVSPDEKGNVIHDSGFMNLEPFIENTSGTKSRLLTLRMLNTEDNLEILDSSSSQEAVVSQTIDLLNKYDFDGVVLDLEMGVLPFENVKDDITAFIKNYTSEVKETDRTFSIIIYGDTFYRGRPFDIKSLAKNIDRVYIMAYDFHKSRGEPGPNFPFDSGSTSSLSLRASPSEKPPTPLLTKEGNQRGGYPYDFKQMISDFTRYVDRDHITVIFGLYGYDWTLGPQGLPLKQAVAVPLNEIDQDGAIVDPDSYEKHILFTDDEGFDHELWYEDRESVDVKIDYLMKQGIGSVGYWVWGYF